jgi:hypothetical protein
MPDVKISALPASTPTSVSLSPVVTSGVTGRCTAAQLVAAGIEAGPTLKSANGTAGTPGISPLADPDTGLSFAADTINFSTGGAQRMQLNSQGSLGIGQNPGTTRLAVTVPFTNVNANLIQGTATAATTVSGSHTSHAFSATLATQVAAGQTNSGTHRGMFLACLRNSTTGADDTGTLSFQRNQQLQYGHAVVNAGMAPNTVQVIGIQMQPLVQSGTVDSMTDIYIGTPIGTGTITNQYAIYQECTAANGGRNYFAGRVGCNTIAPATALDVTGQITVSAGTLAAPSIVFATDTNTGLFNSAADTIAFVTGGASRVTINAGGDVTFLTGAVSSPAGSAGFPTYRFIGDATTGMYYPAAGQIGISCAGINRMTLGNGFVTIAGTTALSLGTAALPAYRFNGDAATGMWSPLTSVLAFSTGGVERLRLDNNLVTLAGNSLRISTSSSPTSAATAGSAGEIRWDSGFLYVCTASGAAGAAIWKRTALTAV